MKTRAGTRREALRGISKQDAKNRKQREKVNKDAQRYRAIKRQIKEWHETLGRQDYMNNVLRLADNIAVEDTYE